MPWKETCPMDQRMQFIKYMLTQEYSMAAVCRHFGISRKTGYKWIHRYTAAGPVGLQNQSCAPHHHPQAVSPAVEQAVCAARQAHPTWGPRKLLVVMGPPPPGHHWPAPSTIGAILHRHGLTVPRRRSRKTPPYTQPFLGCDQPNAVWSADLKGWFRTGDGQRCDPLTINDNYSRYLFRCHSVRPATCETIQPVFEAAFREYGLPVALKTDNGPPFATTTVGGLSRLAIWWIKLGIRPERIAPGQPAQNGRLERLHRTLKQDTAMPPKANGRQQQQAFDRFRNEYNNLRPHEALDMQPPANWYTPSPRPYPLVVPDIAYPADMVVRKVKHQGDITWHCRQVYLSETLAGECVGFRQTAEDRWDIYFGPIRLAQLDSRNKKLIHIPKTRKKPKT